MDAVFALQDGFKKDRDLNKIEVVHNPNYNHHGVKSYVHLLHKYNFEPTKAGPYSWTDRKKERSTVHEKVKAALGRHATKERVLVKKTSPDSQHGEVTAEDTQNDTLYLCKVAVGSPPQDLMVDFDTGSADFWVFSPDVNSTHGSKHNEFNPTKSSSFHRLPGKTWKIEYGDGSSASGSCGTDILDLGGLKVKDQTVELANKLSQQFASNTGDGLLGLAFSTINTVQDGGESDPQATPVENMINQNDIPSEAALFTSAFYSSRDAATSKSFYTFGFIDQDLVKQSGQEIHWVEIDNSDGFWAFSSESASVNGESIPTSSNMAIADTGTTLALMSDEVVDALYAQISGATYDWSNQGYIFPISTKAEDLPSFTVAVGDREYLIQKEDLAFAPTDDGKNWYGGVQSRGSLPFDILGDTFLKSIYAIWDQGNVRFGVVPKLEKTQNLTTPSGAGKGSRSNDTSVTSVSLAAANTVKTPL
ncbi:eukaryotic aspartyl protease [Nemania sp. FL0916]|nr:eukaryotic aspartyl protease [Nemania sp. FL0916]